MSQVKGYAAATAKVALAPYSFERRKPHKHDVVIDIRFCGICHTGIHQVRDEWGGSIFPMVPGHEIAGVVSAVGDEVTRYKVGDHVGVGCFIDSCRHCEECKSGLEQYCAEGMTATYNGRDRDGIPTMGGYSEKIVVDENYVLRIPGNLPLAACAPLLCAGITLYSPLRHWHAGPGKKVVIVGLGGLGHMGVKLAHAMGAEVTVLSHSPRKQEDAKRLGSDHFYATSDPATFEKLKSSFHLISQHRLRRYRLEPISCAAQAERVLRRGGGSGKPGAGRRVSSADGPPPDCRIHYRRHLGNPGDARLLRSSQHRQRHRDGFYSTGE